MNYCCHAFRLQGWYINFRTGDIPPCKYYHICLIINASITPPPFPAQWWRRTTSGGRRRRAGCSGRSWRWTWSGRTSPTRRESSPRSPSQTAGRPSSTRVSSCEYRRKIRALGLFGFWFSLWDFAWEPQFPVCWIMIFTELDKNRDIHHDTAKVAQCVKIILHSARFININHLQHQ